MLNLFLWLIICSTISSLIYGFATKFEFDEGAGGFLWVGIIITFVIYHFTPFLRVKF